MNTVWLDTEDPFEPREVGSKATGLFRLRRLGLPVPRGFVVTVSAFRKFLDSAGIASKLDILAQCTTADALEQEMRGVREAIGIGAMPEDVSRSVSLAYSILGGAVAVRSSGNIEDTEESAFAGAYASFLGRAGQTAILDAIRDCWSSAFSSRVAAYRLQHNMVDRDWTMGVIVQAMVNAEKAGVMFTRNPFRERATILVEAVLGGCDRIVSGAPADLTVQIDRETHEMEYSRRVCAVPRHFGSGASGVLETDLLELPRLLQKKEIDALVSVAVRLEEALHQPQDVEWAIADGQLLLLQTRPLTGRTRPGHPRQRDVSPEE